jgi:Lon protease-like protein
MDLIESLPLFPLSDVVLLPELSIPLHIFEGRYRQMTADALAGSHQIGMVTIHPDSLSELAGDPPIFEIGCLGRIGHSDEQSDGTFQILLLGVSRFRILQEHERSGDRLYRSARVELLSDESPMDTEGFELLADRRRAVLVLLERLVQRVGRKDAAEQAVTVFDRLEPARLINSLTQAIAFLPAERQRLLEANSIISRFEIMADLLRFRLAEFESGEPGSTLLPN